MSSNFVTLRHYNGTIVPDINNNIIYISRSSVFLNDIRGMSFKDTKNVICGRLELNYDDIEIYITQGYIVEEH